jgi:hypothetical protein
MKTIEWNQSPERHDKIVIRAVLRGAKAALFQLERHIPAYLPKYCIMHIGIKAHAEEEFFCDFSKLALITEEKGGNETKRSDDMASVVITSRHDEENSELLHIVYSIRRTENSDKPWLGMEGWQESRHIFDLTASETIDGASTGNPIVERKQGFRSALVLASFAIVGAFVVTVPFVLGSLGEDIGGKSAIEKEARGSAVTAEIAQVSAEIKTTGNTISADKQEPAGKVRTANRVQTSKTVLNEKTYAASKNIDSGPAVPCTRDMADKGIACR